MSALSFREEDHTYWVDGQQITSATQLLKLGGLYGDAEQFFTEAGRERGKAVHALCQSFDLGAVCAKMADERWRGYGVGYVSAVKALKVQDFSGAKRWEEIELIDHHPLLRVACRRDRVGVVWDRKTIAEIKTGTRNPKATGVQLAIQALVAEYRYGLPAKLWQRLELHLKDTGKFSPYVYEDERDFDRALGLIKEFC